MTEFADRRSGQMVLPGMEDMPRQYGPWPSEAQPRSAHAAAVLASQKRWPVAPVGMRGSVGERTAMEGRLQRKAQAHDRWDSYRKRMADDDYSSNYDNGEEDEDDEYLPGPHPRTGLPSWGNLNTHDDIGFGSGNVPSQASFHGSAPSARNAVGKVKWVPTVGLNTTQAEVSSQRVHQIIEDPNTGQTPRIPASIRPDVPHVYHSLRDDYTLIDGNHRASAEALQGRMFMQARVIESDDVGKVATKSKAVVAHKQAAERNPNIDHEEVTRRLYDRLYGTGQW